MKMKLITMLMVTALIVTISGTTQAVSAPSVGPGVLFMASYNQDNGTAYYVDETDPDFPGWDNLADSYDPDNLPVWASRVKPDGAELQRECFNGAELDELEDTWGIFSVNLIRDGILVSNTINPLGGGTVWYTNQDAANPKDVWLVGMFWGGNDTSVSFDEPGTNELTSFTTLTDNVHLELWAVDMSDLDASVDVDTLLAYNSASRTAADEYTGWLDATVRANGVPLLRGLSEYIKFDGALMDSFYFSGDTDAWFDLPLSEGPSAGGIFKWNDLFGVDPVIVDPEGDLIDIYQNWGLQFSTEGWDTYSRDFGGVNAVPEPVTMLGMFLGIGGLTSYMRKRRIA